jgi:isoleucyl-tRNA synthetase
VLDHVHRCLTTWLAPVLVFTAEEAWASRFGEAASVHLQDFPEAPPRWRDDDLAAKWADLRDIRRAVTGCLERARAEGTIGASLQAAPALHLPAAQADLLSAEEWAELAIVSRLTLASTPAPAGAFPHPDRPDIAVAFARADGEKCARCWRVLPEVGENAAHPALCRRCVDAVESALVS